MNSKKLGLSLLFGGIAFAIITKLTYNKVIENVTFSIFENISKELEE